MASCVIRDNNYKRLQRLSGLDEDSMDLQVGMFRNSYGRDPELDELDGADSSPVLIKSLGLHEGKSAYFGKMENIAPDGDLQKAVVSTNNTYKDLETDMIQLDDTVAVNITRRPTLEVFMDDFMTEGKLTNAKTGNALSSIAEKAGRLYGIPMHVFSSVEAKYVVPEGVRWQDKNAFIHNGEIWINSDYADLDAPVHELTHMLLGELKYNDGDLYRAIVSTVAEDPMFRMARRTMYAGYTMEDAMEEYFVTHVARYMSGMPSALDNMPTEVLSKVRYGITRMLDTAFMGANSARSIPFEEIGNMSVQELCGKLGSIIMNHKAAFGGDLGYSHRIAANIKHELIRDGKLKEECV